jgi:hypothetical protein
MKRKSKAKTQTVTVTPSFDPIAVIEARKYGVKDLKNHILKIKDNIKIFREAIDKEKALMKRDREMIAVLKHDIKEAKSFQKKKYKP